MAEVCMIGLGYIGLPTAATIASRGMDVLGVDINQKVVDTINSGEIHIVEPDLDIAVRSAVESGRLRAATEPEASDVFLIAVPTPFDKDKKPDLSYVEAAGRSVAKVLEPGNLVILESTCPVGATETLRDVMQEARPDLSFARGGDDDVLVAHCPERVLPGKVLRELIENDRVIGGLDAASTEAACQFYRRFVEGDCIPTDARTAELAKLTENAFRDVNIAFANELSLICDRLGINVWELIEMANHHPRVNILQPGAGVGGHCIAVDPWFIVSQDPVNARLIRTAREVNDAKPRWVVDQVWARLEGASEPIVACLGLAFKPDVDDFRESPALQVVSDLVETEALKILVVEPHADALPPSLSGRDNVELVGLDEALDRASLVVALVRHTELRERLQGRELEAGRVLDCVNLFGGS